MVARFAIVLAAFLAASPALAQTMSAETAKRFVVGKLFAFSCVDGSRGMGRIYGDGSVIGTIQLNGSGPVKSVWLPAGTLRVKGEAICASLKGMSFEPCFNISRTGAESFRGAVNGLGMVAYCDFTRRSGVAGLKPQPSSQSLTRHVSAAEPEADKKPIRVEAVERQPLAEPVE